MDTVGLIHHTMGFAFQLLEQVVSDLTQEQTDWMPPGNANPIGALYWHTVAYCDQLVHEWGMGQAPLRHSAGWQEKVVIASPPENPEDPHWDLRNAREDLRVDLPALHDYARATAQALKSWAAALTLEDMAHPMSTPIGDYRLDLWIEIFVIWHINAHCGEIAALKGCQGLKGYPW